MADQNSRPFVLAILDGWGFSEKKMGNPIKLAKTPTIDWIMKEFPMTLLQASGLAVGMAWGEAGNSEVGHLNIGAGKIVEQYYSRINRSIKDGSFFNNPAISGAFSYSIEKGSRVHLVGLLTTGTVHASFIHINALISLAAKRQFKETYIHLFLDGRDSGLQEGAEMLVKLQEEINKTGLCKIASVIGRDFAMDRDNNWDFTRIAHELIASANGERSNDLLATISNYYNQSVNDSSIPPIIVSSSGFEGLKDGDSLFFFNFREDSMRQIFGSFIGPNFSMFSRSDIKSLYVSSMTKYFEGQSTPIAFQPPEINNCLAEVLSRAGKTQMHIAETEKYAHITYFLNGLKNIPFNGEADVFIESKKNVEQNPEMSCSEIAAHVVDKLDQDTYDFIVLNFANADFLAHTGNFNATVAGIEAVDAALSGIVSKVIQKGGIIAVTADHGNAESLVNRSGGEAETKHDDSPVFFLLVGDKFRVVKDAHRSDFEKNEVNGILPDIAPTILELMGIPKPDEMNGRSLLKILGF